MEIKKATKNEIEQVAKLAVKMRGSCKCDVEDGSKDVDDEKLNNIFEF